MRKKEVEDGGRVKRMNYGTKQNSRELTFRQTDTSVVMEVLQLLEHLILLIVQPGVASRLGCLPGAERQRTSFWLPQDPEMGSPHCSPPFICGKSLRGPGIKPYIQEGGQSNQQNIEPASLLQ